MTDALPPNANPHKPQTPAARRARSSRLRDHGGNVSRTAAAIGMVRQSLQQKIRELGLREEDWND